MILVYVLLGGAAGGVLGWLFDKATGGNQPKAVTDKRDTPS